MKKRLVINGEEKLFPMDVNISNILQHLQIKSKRGIALAINHQVISKSKWNSYQLQENDQVFIIQAIAGG